MARAVMGGRQGFSLVELLVVIAMIGILVAIGAGGSRALLDRGRLSEALNRVTSDVEQARRLAKRLDRAVTFEVIQQDGVWRSVVDGEGRDLGADLTSGAVTLVFEPPFGTYAGAQARLDVSVRDVD